MSDPHAKEEKKPSGKEENPILKYTKLTLYFFLGIMFTLYFYFNPDFTNNFVIFLHVIQFVCVVALGYMAHKMWLFMKAFAKNGQAIVDNYESQLKHHHYTEKVSAVESKYSLAIKQINSHELNEWKTGLIELENYIRLALIEKGYVGNTTKELLSDAKEKGHKHIHEAENIVLLRELIKNKGISFDYPRDKFKIMLKEFEKFHKTLSPDAKAHDDSHVHH